MHTAGIVLSLLLAALLVVTGGGKLLRTESSHKIRDGLAVPPPFWLLVGVVELATATALVVGVWLEPVGLAGLAGVVLLMVGAVVTRLRAPGTRDPRGVVADVIVLMIAVCAAGLRLA